MGEIPDARNQPDRLAALHDTGLLDSPPEPSFDRLTALASRILQAPVSLVTLIDIDRQFFKSSLGLPQPWSDQRETPLSHSFCQHVVARGEPLVISDARDHPMVYENLAIRDLNVIAYLGIPLVTSTGLALGSFCVIDSKPRNWTSDEIETVMTLAAAAEALVEQRFVAAESRRRLEQIERERAEREAMLERITDAFCAVDHEWCYTYLNTHAETILGRSRDELLGRNMWEAFPEAVNTEFYAHYHRAMAEQETLSFESYYPPFDIWVDVRVYPSPDGLSLYLRDITDRKRYEAALQEQMQQREAFLSTAAHELKTPLTTVKGIGQLIARRLERVDVADERLHHLSAQLNRQVRRLETLVVDLLDVTAMSQGRLPTRPETVDLARLVEDVVSHFDDLPERTANHHIVVDAHERVVGHWDPLRLDQVVTNLISNALKYAPGGGLVQITVHRDGDAAVLSVRDEGIGIPKEAQERIFQPFTHAVHNRQGIHGTGLGLSIARGIVEQYGGTITVQSEVGQGTNFTVRLPIPSAPSGGDEEPATA